MKSRSRYEHLLSPGRIGTLPLPNRIVMTPMGSNLAEEDGQAGARIQRYYEERARGGVGLLIVGVGAIAHPVGACNPNQVGVSGDRFLPGLRSLTERVHRHGSRIALQLQHAGKVATRDIAAGRPMWVPSVLPYQAGDLMSDLSPDELAAVTGDFRRPGAKMAFHEMGPDDIATLVGWFADAAARAQRAGFDGVELHAGHGYILSEFLSPKTNQRADDYGGPIENRARLLQEVVRAVRERVGPRYPLWCRLDAREFRTPGGIEPEDGRRAAELAEEAGVDAIHVSAYADPSSAIAFTEAPLVHEPCGFVELAAAIKQRVSVPVIGVGRIEPHEADDLIRKERIDFVAMGRKLLADPELPNKLKDGVPEQIRPCIYCYHCVGQIFLNQQVACAVNPATGRESEFEFKAAGTSRRVLVIGGGPAGLEAARVAALRGHRVTLCEKSERLGGTVFFSSLVYPENGRLVEWLESELRRLPIDLRLGEEVTPSFIRDHAPEVALVAIGARREVSDLVGADLPHVLTGDDLRDLLLGDPTSSAREKLSWLQRRMLDAGQVLGVSDRLDRTRELSRRWMPIGRRVAVIGGGLVGVELAEFLCERGRKVSIIEEGWPFGAELAPPRRARVLHGLREHDVSLYAKTRVEAIRKGEIDVVDLDGDGDGDGERRTVIADSVIIAKGTTGNREVAEALVAGVPEVHSLGDCSGVGYIAGAMMDAARIARKI